MNDYENNDDYQAAPKSPRNLAADRLARWLFENGLRTSIQGVTPARAPDRRSWSVDFGMTGLEGGVSVYSPVYFVVRWRRFNDVGASRFDALSEFPWNDSRVFGSEAEAQAYIDLLFLKGDHVGARAIPQKETKPRNKRFL